MELYRIFLLLSLSCFCNAGPIIAVIAEVAGIVAGEAAVATVAGSSIASAVGIGASGIWYGSYVIVNGALFYGTGAVAGGALAAGAVAGGVAGAAAADKDDVEAVTDKVQSESIMSSISAASEASVHSEASMASVQSKEEASKASVHSKEEASKASVHSKKEASKSSKTKSMPSEFASLASKLALSASIISEVSKGRSSRSIASAASRQSASIASASATAFIGSTPPISGPATLQTTGLAPLQSSPAPPGQIPPPPGQPVSMLPPENRPKEVPPGVPDYNFRMCQYDIIRMGQNNQNLTFDNPSGYSLRVDNIPPTCMVLATVMLGDPLLGPHPIPMGAASLQWDDVKPEAINLIRTSFGLPPR